MSKITKLSLVILVVIFLFFTQSNNAFAVEGTCSWHGGVNCSAGSDWDGSTICNDGWRDSSEDFYSTKECTQNLHHCTQKEAEQLHIKYDLESKYKKVGEITDQVLSIPMSDTNNSSILRQNAIEALRLQSLSFSAQSDYRLALKQYYEECYALGEITYQKRQQEFLKEWEEITKQSQNTPQYTCQANSILGTDNLCYCNSGYGSYDNQCIAMADYCRLTLGGNSITRMIDGAYRCTCDTGYILNSTQTGCNKVESQTIQPSITQAPPQQVSPPKSTNPVTQNQSSQPKIKPSPISAKQTSITATTSKTDNLATSSIKTEEIKQKVESPKIRILSKIKSFFSKLKFW